MPNYDSNGPPEGNQNAVKRSRLVSNTLRRVATQNPEKLRLACEALLDKAVTGDAQAYKEIRDTLDGKPHQTIGGDTESGDIPVSLTVKYVRPEG